jgi:hypothetical protein
MDMKKILENMDAAAAGKKPSAGAANVNDMKTILESIQQVEECGMDEMPMQPPAMSQPEDKVTMNVNLNARGDAVEDLIKLMGGAMTPQEAPVRLPMPAPKALPDPHDAEMGDMKKMMKISTDGPEMMDDDVEEDWDNSPEEEYTDTKTMTKDLSGGLNREKKAYAATQDGDNPMAVDETAELTSRIKEELMAALEGKYANDAQRKAVHAAKDKKKK